MEKQCFIEGCLNYPAYSCNCRAPVTFICKSHMADHVSFQARHKIITIVDILPEESLTGLTNKLLCFLSKLSLYEISLTETLQSIFSILQSQTEKIFSQIQTERAKLIEALQFIAKHHMIDFDDENEVLSIYEKKKTDYTAHLEMIKNSVEKIFAMKKSEIIESENLEKKPKTSKSVCNECKVGYYIKCDKHSLCNNCKICYCLDCKPGKKIPPEERYGQNLEIEKEPFRESCDPDNNICTYVYKGLNKTLNKLVAVTKIVGKKTEFSTYNLNLIKYLGRQMNSFLWVNGNFSRKNDVFIVTEFAIESLAQTYTLGLSEPDQIKIVRGLIEGFAFMAFNQIYHRNISPHSVLLTPDNMPKIFDFSFAVAQSKDFKSAKITNEILATGNFGYLSPERKKVIEQHRLEPRKPVSIYNIEKSDVFSLGLVILQIFIKDDVSILENAQINEDIEEYVMRIGNEKIRKIVRKMLKVEPECRPYFMEILEEVNDCEFV